MLHDNQKKVCTKCFESSHVYANCPHNLCFKCKKAGHLARACEMPPCARCHKFLAFCKCTPVWGAHDTQDANERDEDDENRDEGDKMQQNVQAENNKVEVVADVHVDGHESDKVSMEGDVMDLEDSDDTIVDDKATDKLDTDDGVQLKDDDGQLNSDNIPIRDGPFSKEHANSNVLNVNNKNILPVPVGSESCVAGADGFSIIYPIF